MGLAAIKPLLWPSHRLREGYRYRDLPALALARLRGLSAQAWEEEVNAREAQARCDAAKRAKKAPIPAAPCAQPV